MKSKIAQKTKKVAAMITSNESHESRPMAKNIKKL
jgi:hypothetical protein